MPELSYAAVAAALELSRLRRQMRVALALLVRYPTEQAWTAALDDPVFVESLNAFAEVLNDIKHDTAVMVDATSPEAISDAVDRHHGRALESIEGVAEMLSLDPDDLLTVLIDA
jgi:hypothetical protein